MSDPSELSIESAAQAMVEDSAHYIDAVSALSGSCAVRADADVVSSSGVKLLARGTRIDPSLHEKLSGHRLLGMTLEQTLSVTGGVTPESLAIDIARRIDADSWYAKLAIRSGDPGGMRHGVSRLHLPREVLFRLTVARDQRPALYRHLIGVALISYYLALRLQLKSALVDAVVTAALCHDLGELYIDPAILEPTHRITDEERRFVYVHPITGWLIVRDLPGLHPSIGEAILQHQERLDGSGYPYGKKAEAIAMAARILAVADVAESIMARFGNHGRLATLLRLNQNRFDRDVVGLLHEELITDAAVPRRFEREALGARLAQFAAVMDKWSRLRAETTIAQGAPGAFLAERMFNLRSVMLQFGFDADSLEMPLTLAEDDAVIAAELTAVMDELQFQLEDLAREFDRRAADWLPSLDPPAAAALADWRQQLQQWVAAAPVPETTAK